MKTPLNVGYIRDTLYNCERGPCDFTRGVLVGLMSGLMAEGWTFEEALLLWKTEVNNGIFDLRPSDVPPCIPEVWREQYNTTEVK